MKRILLIEVISSTHSWNQVASPPLGLLYIAAALRNGTFYDTSTYNVSVMPMHFLQKEHPDFNYERMIQEISPDIVGISSMTPSFPEALKVARSIKKMNQSIFVILGGVHASLNHEAIAENDCFDIIIRGEGEVTFSECAHIILDHPEDLHAQLQNVEGITYVDMFGRIIVTPDRKCVEDINIFPFPARDLVNMDRYKKMNEYRAGGLLLSRGCPYGCSFCYSNSVWKGIYRTRNVSNVIEELKELYYKYEVKKIRFEDDTFTCDRELIIQLCEAIIENNMSFEWLAKTRADLVDLELLSIMKKAGLGSLLLGIETINKHSLKATKKRETSSAFENALSLCHQLGINVIVTIIIGLSTDTKQDMLATMDWLRGRLSEKDKIIRCMYTPFNELFGLIESQITIVSDDLELYTMDYPLTFSKNHTYEELLETKEVADKLMQEYGLLRGLRKYD